MSEAIQLVSAIFIVAGLVADVIAALILIRASNKISEFFFNQMNRTTNEEVENEKNEIKNQQKENTIMGLTILLWGFVVQIIGYLLIILSLIKFE